jgi:hypothetical protein
MPWPAAVAGVAVAVLGGAGLVRASMPQHAAVSRPVIAVTGTYVRPPVPPNDSAAAYFAVTNSSPTADRLESVVASVGGGAVIHTAGMTRMAGMPDMAPVGTITVPAQARVVLSPGHGHVMIEKVAPALRAGQRVELTLIFARAGRVSVRAPVVPFGSPTPTEGSPS